MKKKYSFKKNNGKKITKSKYTFKNMSPRGKAIINKVVAVALGTISLTSAGVVIGNKADRVVYEKRNEGKYSIAEVNAGEASAVAVEGSKDGEKGNFSLEDSDVVIVKNEYINEAGKNEAVFIGDDFGVVDADISGKYLEDFVAMKRGDLYEYKDVYEVVKTAGNLYSKPTQNGSKLVKVLNNGEAVLGGLPLKSDMSSSLWVPVLHITSNGVERGYMELDSLLVKDKNVFNDKYYIESTTAVDFHNNEQTKSSENEKYMKISGEDGLTILRAKPSKKAPAILQLLNGTVVNIDLEKLGNPEKETFGAKWVRVDVSGNVGYVKLDDLCEVSKEVETKENKKINIRYYTNSKGRVCGIDANGFNYSINDVETLLCRGFETDKVKSNLGDMEVDVNISDMPSPSFYIIKIGATREKAEFEISEEQFNKELIYKCEELGIPYGFYYYSAATDIEEAKKELKYINEKLEDFGNRKYNLGYFVIGYEVNDRSSGKMNLVNGEEESEETKKNRILQNTEAVEYLANSLKASNQCPILYTSGDATINEQDKIIDLYDFHCNTGISNVWVTAPRQNENNDLKTNQMYLNQFEKMDCVNVVITQDVIDANINLGIDTESPSTGLVDIDTMSAQDFEDMICQCSIQKGNNPTDIQFDKIKEEELNLPSSTEKIVKDNGINVREDNDEGLYR